MRLRAGALYAQVKECTASILVSGVVSHPPRVMHRSMGNVRSMVRSQKIDAGGDEKQGILFTWPKRERCMEGYLRQKP